VASNLAEGSSRTSHMDFARFIEISTGSLFEAITQAEIAGRQGYLSSEDYSCLRNSAAELVKILSGLRRPIASPRATA
jgi:four helix bundle protein